MHSTWTSYTVSLSFNFLTLDFNVIVSCVLWHHKHRQSPHVRGLYFQGCKLSTAWASTPPAVSSVDDGSKYNTIYNNSIRGESTLDLLRLKHLHTGFWLLIHERTLSWVPCVFFRKAMTWLPSTCWAKDLFMRYIISFIIESVSHRSETVSYLQFGPGWWEWF